MIMVLSVSGERRESRMMNNITWCRSFNELREIFQSLARARASLACCTSLLVVLTASGLSSH
jgi:hypothetical protein